MVTKIFKKHLCGLVDEENNFVLLLYIQPESTDIIGLTKEETSRNSR